MIRIHRDDYRSQEKWAEYFVGNNNGEMMRSIIYIDPRDGKEYTYIISEM